jgi:WD40 repeat protein
MLLTGHEGEIYAARFSRDGNLLASTGFDMKICGFLTGIPLDFDAFSDIWNVYGECDNVSTISGHKGAIMDIHFNTGTRLALQFASSGLIPSPFPAISTPARRTRRSAPGTWRPAFARVASALTRTL